MRKSSEENVSKDPIEELKRIVNDVEQKGEEISEHGREVIGKGQFMVDFARATRAVIPYLPANTNFEYLIDDLNAYDQQADHLLVGLHPLVTEVAASSDSTAGTATLSITGSFSNNSYIFTGLLTTHPEAQAVVDNLYAVAGRIADASQVEKLLETFALDKAPKGKKSPLKLFQTAQRAFEKPVIKEDPIITSLIPMRECIRLVIDELLKRRPFQEKTGNDHAKVMSIGRQLKRDTISIETIDSLGRQWHDEIRDGELSAAKEQDIPRVEWSHRLQRATQLLFSLLSGLDPTKMKHH